MVKSNLFGHAGFAGFTSSSIKILPAVLNLQPANTSCKYVNLQ